MPNFLVEETTVRECGESAALHVGDKEPHDLLLTLEITHVKQQEELDVHVLASGDGVTWKPRPVASFLEKMHCGTYKLEVPAAGVRFLKAMWRVNSRGHKHSAPLFRFCVRVDTARTRAMAGAA